MAAGPPWPVGQWTDGELARRREEIADLIRHLPSTSTRIATLTAEDDQIETEQVNRAGKYGRRKTELDL